MRLSACLQFFLCNAVQSRHNPPSRLDIDFASRRPFWGPESETDGVFALVFEARVDVALSPHQFEGEQWTKQAWRKSAIHDYEEAGIICSKTWSREETGNSPRRTAFVKFADMYCALKKVIKNLML